MPEITLILHNIRSAYNVGAIFRTAEGLGVAKIICSGYTPYPKLQNDSRLPHIANKLHQQIHKTALDAEELVDFEYINDIDSWLDSDERPLFALEQSDDSISIDTFRPPIKFTLLLGEEVNGIEAGLLTKADAVLEIPMLGEKESFNVSVAAGIALYALTRK